MRDLRTFHGTCIAHFKAQFQSILIRADIQIRVREFRVRETMTEAEERCDFLLVVPTVTYIDSFREVNSGAIARNSLGMSSKRCLCSTGRPRNRQFSSRVS